MSGETKAALVLGGGMQVAGLAAGFLTGLLFGVTAGQVVAVVVIVVGALYAAAVIND
jgi:type IV secretory pathway VirB3-like protein